MMSNNDCFIECPECLVDLTPDSRINQLRRLLRKTFTMLDECLAPRIDHAEAFEWLEQREALRHEIEDVIGAPEDANNEE
jgi:hypothetical protein